MQLCFVDTAHHDTGNFGQDMKNGQIDLFHTRECVECGLNQSGTVPHILPEVTHVVMCSIHKAQLHANNTPPLVRLINVQSQSPSPSLQSPGFTRVVRIACEVTSPHRGQSTVSF
eukprot:877634-Prorocentrum_minimum.AAC.1